MSNSGRATVLGSETPRKSIVILITEQLVTKLSQNQKKIHGNNELRSLIPVEYPRSYVARHWSNLFVLNRLHFYYSAAVYYGLYSYLCVNVAVCSILVQTVVGVYDIFCYIAGYASFLLLTFLRVF